MSKKQSYEESLTSLESIIKELEQGQLPLEKAISQYETGVKLSQRCQQLLNEAEQKVTILTERYNKDNTKSANNDINTED